MTKTKYYPLRKGFNDLLGYKTDREPIRASSKSGGESSFRFMRVSKEQTFRINSHINSHTDD